MKRFLVFLFIFTLLSKAQLSSRNFEYTYEGQTLTYTVIDEKNKTVKTKEGYTREDNGMSHGIPGNFVTGDLILPSKVLDGDVEYALTEISDLAFFCLNLTSVVIPNSVTFIGNMAFRGCSSLTSIEIPNSVQTISDYAFDGCSVTSVKIPNSVTSIGDYAFYGCRLNSVEIPNSVQIIGDYAFSTCPGLTSVIIGNSVQTIGQSAFYNCIGLTSVEIGNSVHTIGESAFSSCSCL